MNDIFENTETMKENEHPRFYTAESVMRGHPDKLCDLIADSVLDECLKHDPASRVACEVMATHGHIIVAGEITTSAKPDVFNIVRDTLRDVGYDPKAYQIDCYIHDQSPDIAGAVEPELAEGEDEDTLGAGDQGVMVGYACDETPEYLPMPVVAAQRLVTLLEISRMTGVIPDIGPDGKVQVTMEYNGDTPVRITTVVVSVQHKEDTDMDKLADLLDEYVFPLAFDGMPADDAEIILNPSGKFVQGGPDADTGLTGRKLMVDSYGAFAPHGGGAFSGKDATKVDRSGAYMARFIAKNIVAAGFAQRCQVTLAYGVYHHHAIGQLRHEQRDTAAGIDRRHQQRGVLGFHSAVGGYADRRAADYGFIFYHDSHGLRQNVQPVDVRRHCADSAVYLCG